MIDFHDLLFWKGICAMVLFAGVLMMRDKNKHPAP
jgi:hypothetical protein